MSMSTRVDEDTEGSNPQKFELGGNSALNLAGPPENEQQSEPASNYFSVESTSSVMITTDESEKSITEATEGVRAYLTRQSQESGKIEVRNRRFDGRELPNEFTIRVPINVSSAEEWAEIEEELQSVALDSEIGDTNLYLVVDRLRG